MADYYIDPDIVSGNGTGSGTSSDPFGKTINVLQYALDKIDNNRAWSEQDV
jgi:hypothetical protein